MCSPQSDKSTDTARQYASGDLRTRILDALDRHTKQFGPVGRDDLEAIDEFHFGGRESTRALATRAGMQPGMHVLDVGCGLGGPARTLAAEYGCRVTGLDVTEPFCDVARLLNERVGLADRVDIVCGAAPNLPFGNGSFDAVWLQFAAMNIRDKRRLAAEIARVLRAGGKLALHEVMIGSGEALDYPVFWADAPNLSHLCTLDEMIKCLAAANLACSDTVDLSAETLQWYAAVVGAMKSGGAPKPLNLALVVPEGAGTKSRNVAGNLADGRIRIVQGVFRLVTAPR